MNPKCFSKETAPFSSPLFLGSRKKGGFTLVEIMVVVMILSLLIGIVVPGYRRIRYRVHLNACKANMKTLFSASQLYLFDVPGTVLSDGTVEASNIFQKKLVSENYIKTLVHCPSVGNSNQGFYAIFNEIDEQDKPLQVKCVIKNGPKHGFYNGEFGGAD